MRRRQKPAVEPLSEKGNGFERREGLTEGRQAEAGFGTALRAEDFGGGPQAVRVVNALDGAGIRSAADLLSKSDSDILKMKNMGKRGLERIQEFRRALCSSGRGAIILREDGAILTNLSPAQAHTLFRLAKLELEELRETVVPEKVKVIGELLDMVVLPEREGGGKKR